MIVLFLIRSGCTITWVSLALSALWDLGINCTFCYLVQNEDPVSNFKTLGSE